MDIQKWLEDAMEAEAPIDPALALCPEFFQRRETPAPVFKQKHVPKRRKSDSSLLEMQPHAHRAPPKKAKRPTESSPNPSTHSDSSRPSRSNFAESESSSHRYARKPRRKTRLERYEPKPDKERGKHVHRSRKDESKRTRRKSKRRKDEILGADVAQNFQAKNVSRDRLTVRSAVYAVIDVHADDWW